MVRENVAPQTSRQLVDFFSDLNKVFSLKLELAALVDVARYLLRPLTF
jgi:cell pole-organizing protein PopZ